MRQTKAEFEKQMRAVQDTISADISEALSTTKTVVEFEKQLLAIQAIDPSVDITAVSSGVRALSRMHLTTVAAELDLVYSRVSAAQPPFSDRSLEQIESLKTKKPSGPSPTYTSLDEAFEIKWDAATTVGNFITHGSRDTPAWHIVNDNDAPPISTTNKWTIPINKDKPEPKEESMEFYPVTIYLDREELALVRSNAGGKMLKDRVNRSAPTLADPYPGMVYEYSRNTGSGFKYEIVQVGTTECVIKTIDGGTESRDVQTVSMSKLDRDFASGAAVEVVEEEDIVIQQIIIDQTDLDDVSGF